MAELVGSDYWCVYDECSQGVQLNLWSDPWPSTVASCDDDLPSLFDDLECCMDVEVDHLRSTTQPIIESTWPADKELQVGETYVNEISSESDTEVTAVELTDACGSSQLPDVCTTRNPDLQRAGGCRDTEKLSEQVSYLVQDNVFNIEHDELVWDDIDSRCSNSSEQSFSTEGGVESDKNNNGQFQEMRVASTRRVQAVPKRLAARRAEAALSTCDDNEDDDSAESLECDFNDETMPSRHGKTAYYEQDKVSSLYRSACRELNKNALNARLNRQKKKAYIASLESRQSLLSAENTHLKSSIADLTSERNKLADEVDYLRAVLANDTALARLINGINGANSVHLTSRFDTTTRKRRQSVDNDHSYTPKSRARKSYDRDCVGVCLHVQQSRLSLEFCEQCAQMSSMV